MQPAVFQKFQDALQKLKKPLPGKHHSPPVAVCSHLLDPDCDSIGSQTVITRALRSMGYDARMVINAAQMDGRALTWRIMGDTPFWVAGTDEFKPDECRAIITDCSTLGKVGKYWERFPGSIDWQVDHHNGNTRYAVLNSVDTDASATSQIVGELLMATPGAVIDDTSLLALYAGVYMDTVGFRYERDSMGGMQKVVEYANKLEELHAQINPSAASLETIFASCYHETGEDIRRDVLLKGHVVEKLSEGLGAVVVVDKHLAEKSFLQDSDMKWLMELCVSDGALVVVSLEEKFEKVPVDRLPLWKCRMRTTNPRIPMEVIAGHLKDRLGGVVSCNPKKERGHKLLTVEFPKCELEAIMPHLREILGQTIGEYNNHQTSFDIPAKDTGELNVATPPRVDPRAAFLESFATHTTTELQLSLPQLRLGVLSADCNSRATPFTVLPLAWLAPVKSGDDQKLTIGVCEANPYNCTVSIACPQADCQQYDLARLSRGIILCCTRYNELDKLADEDIFNFTADRLPIVSTPTSSQIVLPREISTDAVRRAIWRASSVYLRLYQNPPRAQRVRRLVAYRPSQQDPSPVGSTMEMELGL